ncbi:MULTISPECIES: hypothetical protein [unclassified Leptolyngbya]|uniref:hypothetical protein n=1 Tax=unclassified Leptolyngbya TaxID=2650499 RepID=UPI00168315AD|nr:MULTISPECIES: hypothetical protein [unclassified Leptolyngbya]MBD1913564.1 hypothetical protein [Leptolyngbya sp. FACHB-8]MBD2155865.1 hypothetical protein [Leptolyngbya sp. FACHB-16]
MRNQYFIMTGLLGGFLLLGHVTEGAAQAQTQTTAPTANQRFVWEPVARIENPRFPVQISLLNQTGIDLDYGFTDTSNASPNTLAPNARATLTLTNPSVLLSINPIQTSTDSNIPLLLFDVRVQSNNAIEVILKPGSGNDLTGDAIGQVLDVQESGGIFVY